MATRSANNLIAGGIQNHGAPITYFTVDAGANVAGETNPGEAMEALVCLLYTSPSPRDP